MPSSRDSSTVRSREQSSTSRISSTQSCGMSSYVAFSVRSALYAGRTAMTFFSWRGIRAGKITLFGLALGIDAADFDRAEIAVLPCGAPREDHRRVVECDECPLGARKKDAARGNRDSLSATRVLQTHRRLVVGDGGRDAIAIEQLSPVTAVASRGGILGEKRVMQLVAAIVDDAPLGVERPDQIAAEVTRAKNVAGRMEGGETRGRADGKDLFVDAEGGRVRREKDQQKREHCRADDALQPHVRERRKHRRDQHRPDAVEHPVIAQEANRHRAEEHDEEEMRDVLPPFFVRREDEERQRDHREEKRM